MLFINALMLLGRVEAKATAIMNLFVGVMQVVLPTLLLIQADGDLAAISAASGIYLFGFTYLYVGIGLLAGLDTTGVGYFSLFVAVAAVVYAVINFAEIGDYPFGVIWLLWSFLWFLFFLLLGLKREALTRFTGWVTMVLAWVTAVLPAFLLLTDRYSTSAGFAAGLAVVGVAAIAVLWAVAGPGRQRSGVSSGTAAGR